MTRDRAIALASDWVRGRYPVTPPVGRTLHFTGELLDAIERESGVPIPPEERGRYSGKWLVSFFCNCDTDALGLPLTRNLMVDEATGSVSPMPTDA